MLTVRHIGDDGLESIVSVVSVNFHAKDNLLIGCGINCVEIRRYTEGYAYVMNDGGKTVAVYNLRAGRRGHKPLADENDQPRDITAELLGVAPRKS